MKNNMEQDKFDSSTLGLINAVQVIFEAEFAKDTAAAPTLYRVLKLLPELHLDPERSEATQLPVCRLLPRALNLGEAGPAAPVAIALRDLAATLSWAQSARHTVESRGAEFMDNYGYSSLGLTGSTSLDVGVMLLGPGITYPLTSYPSEGVFLVIGGSPEWKCGDQPWQRVDAGSIIHRPAGGAEGKRPGNEPMLALYAWLYD